MRADLALIIEVLKDPQRRRSVLSKRLSGAPQRTRRKLRRSRKRMRVLRKLAAKEMSWRVPMAYRSPRWWRRGFLSRSAILYDLERNDASLYISDLHRYASTKRMVHPRLQDLINNKFTTAVLLQSLGVPAAKMAALYWRGGIHLFPSEERLALSDFLKERLVIGERLFFKPLAGAEGKNIFAVAMTPYGIRVNGVTLDPDAAVKTIQAAKRPLIVEQAVPQHSRMGGLFPGTTNTLRLLTILEMSTRQPFLAVAVQRIGSVLSGSVDNWSAGGLSANIDLKTGVLGRATRLPQSDRHLEWFDKHPDTGSSIYGVAVPFWDETVGLVLSTARTLGFLEYIGWDIIISPDGPVILEANINSGMNVLQVHKPLLIDPRARAYFEKRGVVPAAAADVDPMDEDDIPVDEVEATAL